MISIAQVLIQHNKAWSGDKSNWEQQVMIVPKYIHPPNGCYITHKRITYIIFFFLTILIQEPSCKINYAKELWTFNEK